MAKNTPEQGPSAEEIAAQEAAEARRAELQEQFEADAAAVSNETVGEYAAEPTVESVAKGAKALEDYAKKEYGNAIVEATETAEEIARGMENTFEQAAEEIDDKVDNIRRQIVINQYREELENAESELAEAQDAEQNLPEDADEETRNAAAERVAEAKKNVEAAQEKLDAVS